MGTTRGLRVIVAGGSSGIGRATVERFLAAGAIVYSLARRISSDLSNLDSASDGERLRQRSVDVTDADAVGACVGSIVAEGDIDVLVYSAGLNIPDRRLEELTPESWQAMIAANLDGAFYLTASCLPSLRSRQGTVIFVSSASAIWTNQSGPAYQSAKAGLMALARAGNFEEHAHGVRFTTIFPGLVDTYHLDRRPQPPTPEVRAQCLTTDDVASVCEFVASMPPRVCIPEVVVLPTALQTPGNTCIV